MSTCICYGIFQKSLAKFMGNIDNSSSGLAIGHAIVHTFSTPSPIYRFLSIHHQRDIYLFGMESNWKIEGFVCIIECVPVYWE